MDHVEGGSLKGVLGLCDEKSTLASMWRNKVDNEKQMDGTLPSAHNLMA
jgi:hypothetical protein